MDAKTVVGQWPERFDDRMLKQIAFCQEYERVFNHGAPGHLDMLVISRLTTCLQDAVAIIGEQAIELARLKPAGSGDLREQLAAYAHDAWSGWMVYLFQQSVSNPENGTVIIPKSSVDRWLRQCQTAYANLPEKEKDSDRAEADKMIAIVQEAVRA